MYLLQKYNHASFCWVTTKKGDDLDELSEELWDGITMTESLYRIVDNKTNKVIKGVTY